MLKKTSKNNNKRATQMLQQKTFESVVFDFFLVLFCFAENTQKKKNKRKK